jgi:hypothetical protein
MIWNYYNIIRNLFFLSFVIIFYCIFFITDVNAQSSMTICDSTNKGWRSTNNNTYGENVCTTKCSDLKVDGTDYPRGDLSDPDFGLCAGSATSSELTIYRIDLGTSNGFSGADKCTVFEGNITTDFAKLNKGQTGGTGVFKTDACQKGKSYDRVYFYINRIQSFAGQTVFPDNSGTIARTQSTCSSNGATTVIDTSWLDDTAFGSGKWNSLTKCYGAPTGWSTSVYVKASATDLVSNSTSASSNATITYDDFKLFYLQTGTTDSDGFYRENGTDGDNFGTKVDPTDINKNIYAIKSGANFISGLPIVFENSLDKKLNLSISYYSPKRDDDTTVGVTFLFRRNGANAELAGYLPSDNGMYFTFSYN